MHFCRGNPQPGGHEHDRRDPETVRERRGIYRSHRVPAEEEGRGGEASGDGRAGEASAEGAALHALSQVRDEADRGRLQESEGRPVLRVRRDLAGRGGARGRRRARTGIAGEDLRVVTAGRTPSADTLQVDELVVALRVVVGQLRGEGAADLV